ncbi:MAG: hypothetical protein ACI9YU_000336 [Flavobacteriales bacterium]|jgi:hypothetical protein
MIRAVLNDIWFKRGVLIISLTLFLVNLTKVIREFSMVYVDPDQLLMMFGTQEFLAGRFHMPRFFGQDYGSMLESFVAMPFAGLSLELALPIATCVLWLLPYLLISNRIGRNLQSYTFLFVWLLILPVEYVFLGTMPRDFVSGIAITSLALFFLTGNSKIQLILFGLFCILGWSINQNAALFGATITVYAIFEQSADRKKRFGWIVIGYLIGLAIHAGLQWFIALHPEWIVHNSWPVGFKLDLVAKGLSELDTHWAALTPFSYRNSWIYILLFALILLFARKTATRYAAGVLIILLLLSLGMPKVHDGFNSIFSSYERMFMALPVSVFFLLVSLKWHKSVRVLPLLLVMGTTFFFVRYGEVSTRVERHLSPSAGHIIPHAKMEDVQDRLDFLQELADQNNVDVILLGPSINSLDILSQVGHLGLKNDVKILSPGFDRKTWFLREVDKPVYSRILWMQMELSAEEISSKTVLTVTDLNIPGAGFRTNEYYFLIEGDNINPLSVYADCGFKLGNY